MDQDPSPVPNPRLDGEDRVPPDLQPPNPFASAGMVDSDVDVIHDAGPASAAGNRWWSPFAVAGVSLLVFLLSSTLFSIAAIVVVCQYMPTNQEAFRAGLQSVIASRLGLFMMIVLPQCALVATPVAAAILSSEPTRRRLGLVRGHWPTWAWIAAAAATPLVGMITGIVVGLFMDESESLRQMSEVFREHGQSGFLIPLALMVGATPAICEELLFRGYVQTRMTRVFGPLIGIGIASSLFAVFHMDPVHVIAVFPLGMFLGWVTWQSGSLFPAILGHFVNNVISVVAVVLAPAANTDVLALPAISFTLGILGAGVMGMGAVVLAAMMYGSPKSMDAAVSHSGASLA